MANQDPKQAAIEAVVEAKRLREALKPLERQVREIRKQADALTGKADQMLLDVSGLSDTPVEGVARVGGAKK